MTVEPMTDAELAEVRSKGMNYLALHGGLANILARLDAERTRADAAEAERDAALARGAAEERARINRIAVQYHAMAVRDRDRAARSGNYVDAGRYDEQARGIRPMISETRPDLPTPTAAQEG